MHFQELKESCNGKYVYVDPSNVECTNNLKVYTQVEWDLLPYNIVNFLLVLRSVFCESAVYQ